MRIQGSPYGSTNVSAGNFPQRTPAIHQPGPSQAREVFNAPDMPQSVARALNDLQSKIASAHEQIKADPTANKNVIENLPIMGGSATGGAPTGINFIEHQLGIPYRSYRINGVQNGYIEGHCAVAPTGSYPPKSTHLLLWTKVTAFGNSPVLLDIEIYG